MANKAGFADHLLTTDGQPTFEKALTAKPEFSGVSGHMVGETGVNAANGLGVAGAAHGFRLRRYEVTVGHWGAGIFLVTTRGKALADAWRSDAFEGYTFGEFLKMARCRLTDFQVKPVPITVLGKPAFKVDHNQQYVQFVYPDGEFVLNAHPLDVLPETERPRSYRTPTPQEARHEGEAI